jgi:hypothetical protein
VAPPWRHRGGWLAQAVDWAGSVLSAALPAALSVARVLLAAAVAALLATAADPAPAGLSIQAVVAAAADAARCNPSWAPVVREGTRGNRYRAILDPHAGSDADRHHHHRATGNPTTAWLFPHLADLCHVRLCGSTALLQLARTTT